MSLNNCKVELKPRWTKQCVLSVLGATNADSNGANSNNIIFTVKTTKKYPNLLTKDLKDWCTRMNIKQKVRLKM